MLILQGCCNVAGSRLEYYYYVCVGSLANVPFSFVSLSEAACHRRVVLLSPETSLWNLPGYSTLILEVLAFSDLRALGSGSVGSPIGPKLKTKLLPSRTRACLYI